ncbi:calcium-binding protein [Streptomyces sp. S.PB5]|uniref:calcium-binding protein n=1 Tax=Streptomyces sp. S.PB5 TaxID=3020844 RepID=UPI0025B089E9|nr:calcium-binding protein [Streptomyces sp. S.PB5]MDN3023378.1 calcium-binding protein [Streptomyces sp. S.PB5]
MRIRATVAAVSGALALSALAVPAQAADGGSGDITIDKVVVNGGKPVVVGATKAVSVKVSVTATDNSGIAETTYISGFGPKPNYAQIWYEDGEITCVEVTDKTSTCTGYLTFDPLTGEGVVYNSAAGTWDLSTLVSANDLNYIRRDAATTFKVQRASRLTVNASPEPVKKGKTITVTGKLSRANWETNKYAGYASQSVKLQFRKKGSSTYTTVKTIKTSSTGTLSTTVKASADGYYRYSFAGTATTPAVNAAGDFIDVK